MEIANKVKMELFDKTFGTMVVFVLPLGDTREGVATIAKLCLRAELALISVNLATPYPSTPSLLLKVYFLTFFSES